jgi:N4-(beta-N-acetylglucosaminyl)-L-asparaginase
MEPVNRRDFIKSVAAAGALATVPEQVVGSPGEGPVFIATWEWGKSANERAAEVFHSGGSLLDAVEKGINVVEADPKVEYVGYGGLPNSEGVVELDAGIMDGTRHRAGSACGLRGVKTPISVARLVLEKTKHTTMAGLGVQQFAQEMGFHFEQLLTPNSIKKYMEWKANPNHETFWLDRNHHDTIGMVATDGHGHVVTGCSTSGLPWKIPGRVADSPLVGCGYYADDHAGGASATGDGDLMSNYCTSVSIVRMMERGSSPQEACEAIFHHMAKTDPKTKENQCAVIAMNQRGEVGAASMNKRFHLKYAVWANGQSRLLDSKIVY